MFQVEKVCGSLTESSPERPSVNTTQSFTVPAQNSSLVFESSPSPTAQNETDEHLTRRKRSGTHFFYFISSFITLQAAFRVGTVPNIVKLILYIRCPKNVYIIWTIKVVHNCLGRGINDPAITVPIPLRETPLSKAQNPELLSGCRLTHCGYPLYWTCLLTAAL